MKAAIGNVTVMVGTNTALFTGLDMGQWIADTLGLKMLLANLVAAVIATALGIALNAGCRWLGLAETTS